MSSSASSRQRDERGTITLYAVVFAVGLLLMIGLVVDGGGKIRALQRANTAAEDAARAAGQAVDVPSVVRGAELRIDPTQAQAAARRYLNQAGVQGRAEIIDDTHLRVVTSTSYDPIFLNLIGVQRMDAHGEATVVLVRGITAPQ